MKDVRFADLVEPVGLVNVRGVRAMHETLGLRLDFEEVLESFERDRDNIDVLHLEQLRPRRAIARRGRAAAPRATPAPTPRVDLPLGAATLARMPRPAPPARRAI